MAAKNSKKRHVIVIGAGALGCWTAWHLRQQGCAVTLLDMVAPGQVMASSGGETRVIRATYGRSGHYTAMIEEATQSWRDLETHARLPLLHQTGVLWLHCGDGSYLAQSQPHLQAHGFVLEKVPLDVLESRYPAIRAKGLHGAFLEPGAGVLMARQACQATLRRCLEAGVIYQRARAIPGKALGEKLGNVELANGSRLAGDDFVFACGPWLGLMFPETLCPFLATSRQEVCFFKSPTGRAAHAVNSLPVWVEFNKTIYYGLPDIAGSGLKVALDERGEPMDLDQDERQVSPATINRIRAFLAERFPNLKDAPLVGRKVCQYTNTPDGELLLDRHPVWRNAWFLGGGSGHAFKLAPVIGRIMAAQVLAKASPIQSWQLQGRTGQGGGSHTNKKSHLGSQRSGAIR